MASIGISNEKAKIYLSYNKFVIETMNNEPIDTIDLSGKYVRVKNLSINGDISSNQIYRLDNSIQFYQTVNVKNEEVNNGDITNNTITSVDTNGVSSNITDWRIYDSWNISTLNGMLNTNPNMILSTTKGATILLDGYYKVTVNLVTRSNINKTAVCFRLAKNNIMEGPVCCIGNTLIDNNIEIFAASGTITWIFNCVANDEISIYTSRYGASGKVETPEGISSLLIEYKGN